MGLIDIAGPWACPNENWFEPWPLLHRLGYAINLRWKMFDALFGQNFNWFLCYKKEKFSYKCEGAQDFNFSHKKLLRTIGKLLVIIVKKMISQRYISIFWMEENQTFLTTYMYSVFGV